MTKIHVELTVNEAGAIVEMCETRMGEIDRRADASRNLWRESEVAMAKASYEALRQKVDDAALAARRAQDVSGSRP